MTDRELLELAARAVGWPNPKVDRYFMLSDGDNEICYWNPLTDDGDALRLAVKLQIEVVYYLADVEARHDKTEPVWELLSEHSDPYAATRRAIVRAAAEIGKDMK